ncbi:MAG: endonuclease/exonuclease/phosphatase family protein [Acholeplasmataceae bacterium]|nr:endonuclease/exonuclease/phosphatase family protein [Acholeplasmataceae bacterium]
MKANLLTFNLRYPFGNDGENSWENRKLSVIEFINDFKPNIIGAQEVYDFMKDEILAKTFNYLAIGIPRTPKGEGVPIFYNPNIFEVINSGNFWLSVTPTKLNSKSWNSYSVRMCTWAEFCFLEDRTKKFRVFNTHLDHQSEEARINGFKVLLNKIKKLNKNEYLPIMITGDFNAKLESTTIKEIEKNINEFGLPLKHVYKNGVIYGTTFHSFTGRINGEPIDYIYYSNDIKVSDLEIHRDKYLGKYVSDHYPVSINFEI